MRLYIGLYPALRPAVSLCGDEQAWGYELMYARAVFLGKYLEK